MTTERAFYMQNYLSPNRQEIYVALVGKNYMIRFLHGHILDYAFVKQISS